MSTVLPLDTILEPQYRFVRRKTWVGDWQVLPSAKLGGFFLEEFWNEALPGSGQLIFRYDAGYFSNPGKAVGNQLGVDANGQPSEDIDLVGSIIRLQMAPGANDPNGAAEWKTVGLYVVEYQQDTASPGSDSLLMSRRYYCQDILTAYTKRWPLRYHGLHVANTGSPTNSGPPSHVYYLQAEGHPGYNSRNTDGRILGNRSDKKYYDAEAGQTALLPWAEDNYNNMDSGGSDPDTNGTTQAAFQSKLYCHCFGGVETTSGNGCAWTDLQAVEHALAVSRPPFTPFFYFTGNTALLSLSSFHWDVHLGMTAWDFLQEVCDRSRGRGLCFLSWNDDTEMLLPTEAPTIAISPFIQINTQFKDDLTYKIPSTGGSAFIGGAEGFATTTSVDLTGDHRNVSGTFQMGDRWMSVYDTVETLSEYIQLLVNLDLSTGSLTKQWIYQDEDRLITDYQTDPIKVMVWRYDPIFQLYGINMSWRGTASDGKYNSNVQRVDWRCDDDGNIGLPSGPGAAYPDTAPDSITLLGDIPAFDGYDYSLNPPRRYDQSQPEMVPPDRRPIMFLYRNDDEDIYSRADEIYNFNIRVFNRWRVEISAGNDRATGLRLLSGRSEIGGGGFNPNNLIIVCGLELPHRVRMKSYREPTGLTRPPRHKVITVPGLHLWLADPNAIWELDHTGTPVNAFLPPLRNAAGGSGSTPGKIRDDRDRLAVYHALATSWYLTERRNVSWQLKDCGFLPSFTKLSDPENDQITTTTQTYPKLGDLITTVSQGGSTYTINTPVTKIHYSHVVGNGTTTWITDWSDLDVQ